MGVAVSDWRLARAVSLQGELGVVSGTALAMVLTRRLQDGDIDGRMREALDHFPNRVAAERIVSKYFRPNGRQKGENYLLTPMPNLSPSPALNELTVAANFVEVFLAKQGHEGVVGINLLEKIQLPTLASLYGAMLAGVDYVLMGAGIPRSIPGIIDLLATGAAVEHRIDVAGALPGESFSTHLDPAAILNPPPVLKRPKFIAIVASATLAITLAKKSTGKVDGFVVEGDLAGGHNAPPRGAMQLDPTGQPIYGPRDAPDLEKIRELGLPFWLAGSYASPDRLKAALEQGAAGIQVGTAFAFCNESGIEESLKRSAIRGSLTGLARVFTDPLASPTGFPFKVVDLEGTLSDKGVYLSRPRICDLGYLRQLYRHEDGSVGYRCAGEPVEDYVRKGGVASETEGRKCLCNGLAATAGIAQPREDGDECALVTAGNELADIARLLSPGREDYSAQDVVRYLRGPAA